MEYQKNIIFILVFYFSLVEPIPHSGEARYGAHQGSNWSSNQNQSQQSQNYARPQNFYPAVKNANNRNTDFHSYERNYDNRYGTLSNAPGEKRLFYEGPNGRNKLYRQPSTSATAGGSVFREKSSLEAVPQSYRPTRPYYEYDDRDNERYTPPVERSYQHPANRPYYNTRVPYQRSISENFGNRYKDTPSQKPRYFDKQVASQNMLPSPLDHKYPYQNRPLSSIPETLRRVPNAAHNSMPELPIASQPRREVNEMMSDPIIQKYLASNHKRYLILHTNGTVEHVDSLESIVQSYPNFVMFKAGDIITNPHNSTLELTPQTRREEIFRPNISEQGQQIIPERNDFPTYGHNSRAPYVTEKTYVQHIDRPVNIPDEDDSVSDDGALALTSTPASLDSSSFVEETAIEYYTTPSPETTTEYNTLSPLVEHELPEYGVINAPNNFVETTTKYLPYSETSSEFATATISNTDDVVQEFTEQQMENTTEDSITKGIFFTGTEDYSTLTPDINPDDGYMDNATSTENTHGLDEEKQIDILSKLFNYRSVFGKFLQEHFGAFFSADKLNNETKNKIGRRIREVTSASDPSDVMDILEAITQLALTDQITTEPEDIVLNTEGPNTVYMEDSIYVTPSSVDAASTTFDYHTVYPETSSFSNLNEDGENLDGLNPFQNMSRNLVEPEKVENIYDPLVSDEYNDPSSSYPTMNYGTNPFTTFDTVTTSNPFENPDTENMSITSTESESYSTIKPVTENIYEGITNPFIESTTQENRKLRKRHKNKKKIQPATETYSVDSTNPFVTSTTASSTILNEEIPYDVSETLIANDVSKLPTETNPFIVGLQSPNASDHYFNPFTENNLDDNIIQSSIETETNDTSSFYEGTENSYEIDVVPFAYLPTDTSSYDESTANPESGDNSNTESSDDEDVPTVIISEEEVADSTSTEEPAVWFKTDADFWEKLTNGTIPYDVVYLFQVHDQPLVEKDAKTTIFPNGTVVQEYIETVWEREGDSKPIVVQSSKTVYPEEEP